MRSAAVAASDERIHRFAGVPDDLVGSRAADQVIGPLATVQFVCVCVTVQPVDAILTEDAVITCIAMH